MKCPNDQTTLVMSERSGVEIDYCPECRGVWLDRGELDKIIDRAGGDSSAAGSSAALPSAAAATAGRGAPYSEGFPQDQRGYGQEEHGYGQEQYGQQQGYGQGPGRGYGQGPGGHHGPYRRGRRENWLSQLFD